MRRLSIQTNTYKIRMLKNRNQNKRFKELYSKYTPICMSWVGFLSCFICAPYFMIFRRDVLMLFCIRCPNFVYENHLRRYFSVSSVVIFVALCCRSFFRFICISFSLSLFLSLFLAHFNLYFAQLKANRCISARISLHTPLIYCRTDLA